MPEVQRQELNELGLLLCGGPANSGMRAPAGRRLHARASPVCRASPQTLRALVWVFLMPNLSSENGKIIPAAKWTPFHSVSGGLGSCRPGLMNRSRKMNDFVLFFFSFSF